VGAFSTGSGTEMSKSFSSLGTSQKDGVLTSGGLKSELIESQSLTTSSDNSFSGLFGESQSADGELGEFEESNVVGDGGNADGDFIFSSLKVLGNTRNRDGVSVGSGLMESLEDSLVEGSVSSSGQELVQSNQELVIRIDSSGRLDVSVGDSATGFKIDTLKR